MEAFTKVSGRTQVPSGAGAKTDAGSPHRGSKLIGIVGLGYVGLPTALAMHHAGRSVLGIDISQKRLAEIREEVCDLTPADCRRLTTALKDEERFEVTGELSRLAEPDALIVCVPTPVDAHQVPDLQALKGACEAVCRHARAGQTIILTSTTYVGATRDLLVAPLAERDFVIGADVFIAFSPERIDPANTEFPQEVVPRVLGAVTPRCAREAQATIATVAPSVHLVSSPQAAEMTKLYENIFRAVNLTLANEIAEAAGVLGLSAPEIIDAAATKPYGFMPFHPGPGVGGHCIPCDPHYLLWQLRPHHSMPLVERAMTGIAQRPRRVAERAAEVLAQRAGCGLEDARILLLGVAYKPGVADVRESSALTLIDLLHDRGARVEYHDPLVPVLERRGETLISVPDPEPGEYDLMIAHTLHPEHDYGFAHEGGALLDCTYRLPGRNEHL
jgi:UDP-N-acetyl-D-glucosamine dehydrogenase